jgi:hypothetical protein
MKYRGAKAAQFCLPKGLENFYDRIRLLFIINTTIGFELIKDGENGKVILVLN